MNFASADGSFFSNELSANAFLLARDRIRKALLQTRVCCISSSVNWTEMPCCAAVFVTMRSHSAEPAHEMRGPDFWMAISKPKRTAALSWLSTVTMHPRSMTETCPLSALDTSPVFRLIVQMRVVEICSASACSFRWLASGCWAKSVQSVLP